MDIIHSSQKAIELAYLVKAAESEIEKAAIYGATEALVASMRLQIKEEFHGDHYASEKVTVYREFIGQALGYRPSNGHDLCVLIGFAVEAAGSLKGHMTGIIENT